MRAVRAGTQKSQHLINHWKVILLPKVKDTMRYCPACDKDETREECKAGGEYWDENSQPAKAEDPRSMPAKINLAKNKLRAMGLKMSYDMEGDMVEGLSVKDQMKVSQEYFKKRNARSPEEKAQKRKAHAKSRAERSSYAQEDLTHTNHVLERVIDACSITKATEVLWNSSFHSKRRNGTYDS